jgi:hypothetical protein
MVTPLPDIIFRHPFTRKLVCRKALDLSGSGMAVEEDTHSAVLLPGLMIPHLELNFANSLQFSCRAQVIYRHAPDGDPQDSRIKCGLAILDMEIEKHVQLVALLQQVENKKAYICNKVDLDGLWDFFFETGFIYPHKYAFIERNKRQIKETYEKLYTQNPNIARHFVYQDKGRILAHMAMVRFYENTWMIHHHAARNSEYNRAGLMVLNQIGSFGNDSHRLFSIHMDYLICYYRPDNKFPKRVFGGAVRTLKKIKGCAEDDFAYLHLPAEPADGSAPAQGWELENASESDLEELENFYEHASGGLMINALNLEPGNTENGTIGAEYRKLGFRRVRRLFALKKSGELKAVLMLNQSDIGLNLSDLTNAVSVFVVDPEGLTGRVLSQNISALIHEAGCEEMPVLIYPADWAKRASVAFEKIYTLWVINLQHTDDYFRYLNRLLRFYRD